MAELGNDTTSLGFGPEIPIGTDEVETTKYLFLLIFLGNWFLLVKYKTELTLSTLQEKNSHGISLILTLVRELKSLVSFLCSCFCSFSEILYQFSLTHLSVS